MSGNNLELMHTLVSVNFISISTVSDGPLLNSDTTIQRYMEPELEPEPCKLAGGGGRGV